jgi:hypothetical protein
MMSTSPGPAEPMARLLSVNLAVPASFRSRGGEIRTGIFKEPAAGPVALRRLTPEGDVQVD